MKAHTEYLTFHTKKRRELVHLTPTLEAILERSGISEGFMLVSAMHITAGVFVNDDESGPSRRHLGVARAARARARATTVTT